MTRSLLLVGFTCACACGEPLPTDVADYASTCIQVNAEEIPPDDDVPHGDYKTVYACHVSTEDLAASSYPDGAIMVKAARKSEQDYPFLIATARKQGGTWSWAEYTRNFPTETFLKLPIAEAVCINCHQKYEAVDWIATPYDSPLQ
jgi:hypothetical protein